MKNKFQSKSVPRGTRTIWRYLSAFILFFALSIGNVWGTTQTIGFTTATCSKNASSGGERSLTNVTNLTVAHELVSTTSGALATYATADKEFELSNKNTKGYSRGAYKWNVNTGTKLGTSNNTVGYSVVVGDGYQFTVDSISFAIGATANMIYQVIIYQGSDTLYKSSELTFTRGNNTANSNHTLKVNGLSAQSALQNLTGTFYVRARFAFNSTGKYFFLPAFTVTGDLHETGGGGSGNVAPSISAPTADSEAIYLLNAEASELSVTASGTPDPSYQWYYKASKDATDSTEVGSATSSSYTPVTTSAYDRYYYCKVSNTEGVKISKFFRVQVLEEAVAPTITFNNGSYIIEDLDLDLSSLFTSNSAGAVTYSITDAGTTGALLRADGKSLYATTAGTATIQASQAANGIYAAKAVTATVSVAADENLLLKVRLSGSAGATKSLSGSKKTGATAAVQQLGSSSPYKISNDFKSYVALTLPSGEYFHAGDSVVFDLSKAGEVYCGTLPAGDASEFPEGSALLGTTTKSGSIYYYVLPNTLPANTSTIYTSRSSSTYNGTLTYMAVYRIPTCQDPATALSLSSDAAATIYAGDVITFSTTGGNGGTVTIEGGDSETITDSKWTATEGEHTFTASQAKNGDYCAQESELVLTVLPASPVATVTVSGATAAYKGYKVIYEATAEYATQYRWTVDGVAQGSDSAKLHFTPTASKTYSIVCEARNKYNETGVWIASTAKSLNVTALSGELIRATLTDGETATVTGLVGGTADPKLTKSNKKMDNDKYFGVEIASGYTFQEGDTVIIKMTTAGSNYPCLFEDKTRTNVLYLATETSSALEYKFVLPAKATGLTTVYISRHDDAYKWNPVVSYMSVVRPMPVKSTAEVLTDVKINGTAISSTDLATLKTADYVLDLFTEYAAAPTVKFAKQITKTYEDDSQKVTTDTVTVTAAVESGKWQAQATIGTITYTVKMAKVSAAKVYYYDGATKLGEETVAIDGNPIAYAAKQSKPLATFKGWYANSSLTGDAVTIAEAVITKDTTFYGKWEYTYTESFNIEQWVLTNGAGKGSATKTDALMAALGSAHYLSNIEWSNTSGKEIELDELNNAKNDSLRNYSYLGLKVKNSGKLLNFRVAPSSVVKVKFGELKMTPKVSINGGDYAAMTISSGVYTYTATGEDLISIYIDVAEKAVVFKQIMIDAELVDVMPAINYATAENGTISGLKLGIPGETIKVYPVPAEGYMVSSVTVNGNAITPSEGVYSFEMPSTAANVAATFAVYTPPTFTVTYKANGGTGDDIEVENATTIADNTFAYADHIFAGWNTQADGNGDAYAVGAAVSEDLILYAQWIEFSGCFYYAPTKPAEAVTLSVNDLVPGAIGGSIKVLGTTMKNTQYGLSFESSSSAAVLVTLSRNMEAGTIIKSTVVANVKNTESRGLLLNNAANTATIQEWKKVPTQDPDTFEFTYTVQANDGLAGTNQFCIKRASNAWLIALTVENCAPEQYTVTYKYGETTLGTEGVYENGHPTASEINARKKGYVLDGWSLTSDGDVVELSTITITEDKTLYAQYSERDCSPMGVKFSMEAVANEWSSDYQPNGSTIESLADYATISGGEAYIGNGSSNKHVKVLKTSSAVQLTGSAGFIRVLLDCPLAANDTIKLGDTEKFILSVDSLQTKKANVAKNTHYYVVPAAWANADTIYVWRDGNNVNFTSIQVVRPEIFTVSFNKLGHGSDVADITGVIKGSKITAPTAPTDEDYAFAGWYKENTLSNAWDFANDAVTSDTTLYAKWIDMRDATLKSLKYGTTDIVLVEDKYEYNVEVPSYTTAVPALTAETSNPNATAVPYNAEAFDEGGSATSTVVVTPEKEGAATKTYTVIFTKAAALPQVDVTATTEWDFTGGNAAASKINLNYVDVVLANVAGVKTENINAQALLVNANYISNAQLQAKTIMFKTTVPGELTIRYGCTSNKGEGNERTLYINDQATISATYNDVVEYKQVVPAGEVTIKAMYDNSGTPTVDIMNYKYIKFTAASDLDPEGADYKRDVTAGRYGTICLPNGGAMVGAAIFEIAYFDIPSSKIYFDEVLNGTMEAGMPYIFLPNENVSRLGVYYTDAANAAAGNNNGLYGSYDQVALDTDGSNYILLNNQYCRVVNANTYVGANRAYIKLTQVPDYPTAAPAPGRRRISMGVQGTQVATGIDAINASEQPMKIMIDGQMYILRGEKMYDATGRLVK